MFDTRSLETDRTVAMSDRDEPPPSTFVQCITQAQLAAERALKDGLKYCEIEFPPLPTAELEDSSSSSEDLARANVRLAIDFSKRFADQNKVDAS